MKRTTVCRFKPACPPCSFRMMTASTWMSPLAIGQTPIATATNLTADQFRKVFAMAFRRELVRAFFAEIWAQGGEQTISSVVRKVVPDRSYPKALRVWYARTRGEHIPGPAAVEQVRRVFPDLRMDLHHPMLVWLERRDLDERTIRRLKSKMPDLWRQASIALAAVPTSDLLPSRRFVDELHLDKLGYLDALMLFAVDRMSSRVTPPRRTALNRILWLLPVLYPDDPLWMHSAVGRDRMRLTYMMTLIDYSLGLDGEESPAQELQTGDRYSRMFQQHWGLQQRRARFPQACRTMRTRRHFYAQLWRY
ncbi:hypothetical protein [Paucibacter sp. B51]|uniref:hypothetical protein n=1 Tax=Paucibacter sp. B51 TaxID=2993315 RepID=UPI0022EC07C0|nr:hypothetical protein [Paucibacter sp. B51]